jgi:hypothetical protein
MKHKSSELIKSMPQRIDSQGQRDVTIMPSRGKAATVKAACFTKKKKSNRNKIKTEKSYCARNQSRMHNAQQAYIFNRF